MLDKFVAENAEAVKKEAAEDTKAAEPAKTPEAAKTEEPAKTSKAAKAVEPVKASETVKAEPKKKGYLSEINGVEVDFELQYRDRETDMKDIARRVTEDYARRGKDASEIELIQVYLKPTDFTAYYVINNSYEGKIALF